MKPNDKLRRAKPRLAQCPILQPKLNARFGVDLSNLLGDFVRLRMTKRELIESLSFFSDDAVVICKDEEGLWDNIERIEADGSSVAIIFGAVSPFSDE